MDRKMSYNDDAKKSEEGKTSSKASYNIDRAISKVRSLGQAQIATQSRRLHQFRPERIDQLEARYRSNPGKPVIHLSDLPIGTAIRVNEDGLAILRDLWDLTKMKYSQPSVRRLLGLENIYGCAVKRYYSYVTLESLQRAKKHVGLDIDSLEPYVTHVKCHKNNWPKEIEPRLPFNFMSEEGAVILGYYTDSRHGNCSFANKNMELHGLMRRAVERTVGRMQANTTVYQNITETNWSYFLRTLVGITGIDTSLRQKVANNPVPPWVFVAPRTVASAYLRALWTAEGTPEWMRLVQSVVVPSLEPYRGLIARKDAVTPYNSLPDEAKRIVNQNPSMLLTSAAILQRSFGIDATLKPSVVYVDFRKEITVLWTTELTSTPEIAKFSSLINFDSTEKKQLLQNRIHSKSSPPSFFSPQALRISWALAAH